MDQMTQQFSAANLSEPAPRISPVQQLESKGSFFSLPLEVRQLIYFHTLRVDCGQPSDSCRKLHQHVNTHRGSTKVLRLCSQSYREAIVYLHEGFEAVLLLAGSARTVLREPLANGAPHHFIHLTNNDRVCIPQTFSELNVLRLPRIVLDIRFPDDDEDTLIPSADNRRKMANLERQVSEVLTALQKNHSLKELTISLQRQVEVPRHFLKFHPGLQRLVRPILRFAARNALEVPIKDNATYVVVGQAYNIFPVVLDEPMLSVIMNDALNLDVTPRLIPRHVPLEDLRGGGPPPRNFRSLRPVTTYRLLPECRQCYQLFSNWDRLDTHLNGHARHRKQFVSSKWNELHPRASLTPPNYVCLTCAKQYVTMGMLEQHYEMFSGHRRFDTVAPRYANAG